MIFFLTKTGTYIIYGGGRVGGAKLANGVLKIFFSNNSGVLWTAAFCKRCAKKIAPYRGCGALLVSTQKGEGDCIGEALKMLWRGCNAAANNMELFDFLNSKRYAKPFGMGFGYLAYCMPCSFWHRYWILSILYAITLTSPFFSCRCGRG